MPYRFNARRITADTRRSGGRRMTTYCRPVITIARDAIDGTVWAAWCPHHRWDGPQRHNEQMARIDGQLHREAGGQEES